MPLQVPGDLAPHRRGRFVVRAASGKAVDVAEDLSDPALALHRPEDVQGNGAVGVVIDVRGGESPVVEFKGRGVEGVEVLDTQPDATGALGRGVTVQEGSTFVATAILLQGNHEVGLFVENSTATLQSVEVYDTQPNANGEGGAGVSVQDSTLVATDCPLQGNHELGLHVSSGSTATLQGVQILDTQPDDTDGLGMGFSSEDSTLALTDYRLVELEPDWRTRLLSVITDPNVAYFLMIIGFYGLIFELANPGSLVPGTIGVISLLLALFAFQVLPVNFAGLALILVGLGLIAGEALMPSFGILGIGGIVAFVIGSVILMDAENLSVSLPLIGGVAGLAAALLLWMMVHFMRLRRRPARTGKEEMLGTEARALEDFDGDGHVWLHNERWRAHACEPVRKGQALRVVRLEGLTVEVEPIEESSPET